jgi:hypothetical protein
VSAPRTIAQKTAAHWAADIAARQLHARESAAVAAHDAAQREADALVVFDREIGAWFEQLAHEVLSAVRAFVDAGGPRLRIDRPGANVIHVSAHNSDGPRYVVIALGISDRFDDCALTINRRGQRGRDEYHVGFAIVNKQLVGGQDWTPADVARHVLEDWLTEQARA